MNIKNSMESEINDNIKSNLSRKIKHYRKLNKLTLEQLSEKVGISPNYLSEIERGLKEPSYSVIENIAKSLNLDYSVFFDSSSILESQYYYDLTHILKNKSESDLKFIYDFIILYFNRK